MSTMGHRADESTSDWFRRNKSGVDLMKALLSDFIRGLTDGVHQ